MGKKKRYRLREKKYGRKYALKYGETMRPTGTQETIASLDHEQGVSTSAPLLKEDMPATASTAEEQTWWPLGESIEATPAPKKKRTSKKTAAKKEATQKIPAASKTVRKRTTRAKTNS